jgi:ribosomal protein S18 acetylase RimI-like enzyme
MSNPFAGESGRAVVFKEILVGTDEYRLECELRNEVLRKPLGLSLTAEELAEDAGQWHFGLFDPAGNLVACVLAAALSPTQARIRQMAVSPAHQRRGLGRRAMKELETALRSRGFTNLVLHARESAVGFYEKLGYTAVGDGFVDVTVPHVRMAKLI